MRILIKNGTVVTAEAEIRADLLIDGEKIAALGQGLDDRADTIVDASGRYLLPGGVDNHVHFGLPFQGTRSAGCDTSPAAVAGGTTTIVDFVSQPAGMGLLEAAEKQRKEQFDGRCTPDYAFHAMIQDHGEGTFADIPRLPEIGISTLKMFMAYRGSNNYCEDRIVLRATAAAAAAGILPMIHAENSDIVDYCAGQLVAQGKLDPRYHGQSRPALAEAECINRAIAIARTVGSPVYFVHVSAAMGAEILRQQIAAGARVFGETCPQYLCLSEAEMDKSGFEGAKFVCSPPLRSLSDQEALWQAVRAGSLHTLATDHCAFNFAEQKMAAGGDFTRIPNGLPGVQHRLHLLWSFGVSAGRLSPSRAVDLLATMPAKLNGIYPQKGALQPGSDADLVVFDPDYRGVFRLQECLEGVDYTPYQGLPQLGRAEQVYLRGRLAAQEGRLAAGEGEGRYVFSKPYGRAYQQ